MAETEIKDRIGEYLIPYMNEFVFDELSDTYMEKAGVKALLQGISVPIKKDDLRELTNLKIARSMAMVIGCDPNFPHKDKYIEYIKKSFGDAFVPALLNEGVEYALKEEYERACICFRGAMLIDPENVDALFCYGRALKDAYEEGEGEEYVGRFKAESLDAFERMALMAPDDERGFYFLGFGYLNLGLYMKAKLTFQDYLKLADVTPEETAGIPEEALEAKEEVIKEVKEWLVKLEGPVEIEGGYNHILAGRDEEGIRVLLPFTKDKRFKDWWPLYFYLGVAYESLGDLEEAVSNFTKVLKYSPSDINTMEELVQVYKALGNKEMAKKYSDKIKVVKRNIEEERAENNPTVC